jgi:hypothetical protein
MDTPQRVFWLRVMLGVASCLLTLMLACTILSGSQSHIDPDVEFGMAQDMSRFAGIRDDATSWQQLASTLGLMRRTLPWIASLAILSSMPCVLMLLFASQALDYLLEPAGALCRLCEYDLTGNVSGICPECGTRVLTMVRARRIRWDRLLTAFVLVSVALTLLLVINIPSLDGSGPSSAGIACSVICIGLGLAVLRGTELLKRLSLAVLLTTGGAIGLLANIFVLVCRHSSR